jgi:hypothetical protein
MRTCLGKRPQVRPTKTTGLGSREQPEVAADSVQTGFVRYTVHLPSHVGRPIDGGTHPPRFPPDGQIKDRKASETGRPFRDPGRCGRSRKPRGLSIGGLSCHRTIDRGSGVGRVHRCLRGLNEESRTRRAVLAWKRRRDFFFTFAIQRSGSGDHPRMPKKWQIKQSSLIVCALQIQRRHPAWTGNSCRVKYTLAYSDSYSRSFPGDNLAGYNLEGDRGRNGGIFMAARVEIATCH